MSACQHADTGLCASVSMLTRRTCTAPSARHAASSCPPPGSGAAARARTATGDARCAASRSAPSQPLELGLKKPPPSRGPPWEPRHGWRFLMSEVPLYGTFQSLTNSFAGCLAPSQSLYAEQFCEPGLIPAPKGTSLSRQPSMSTYEQSARQRITIFTITRTKFSGTMGAFA